MFLLSKYTFDLKGSTTVLIKGANVKRQTTLTFTVSASGSFLRIQLMYNGKTKRCLPKYDFPNCFDVTFTPNYWSNFGKCFSLFEKSIFPYLKAKKDDTERIVMDTFKGHDKAEIK